MKFRWPFGRRKPLPPTEIDKRMTEDWRVGDLAVCIFEDWEIHWPENPKINDLLRVAAVDVAFSFMQEKRFIALGFESKPPQKRWNNTAFRKANNANEPGTMNIDEMIRRHSKQPQEV